MAAQVAVNVTGSFKLSYMRLSVDLFFYLGFTAFQEYFNNISSLSSNMGENRSIWRKTPNYP